jgi:ATP-dependent Lon protease
MSPSASVVGLGFSVRWLPQTADEAQAGSSGGEEKAGSMDGDGDVNGERLIVEVCSREPGRGELIVTGTRIGPQLLAVIKEARVWADYMAQDIARQLGASLPSSAKVTSLLVHPCRDLHVHFRGGWDGMNALRYGAAVGVAMVSLLVGRHPRSDVAVIGALNALGQVLPSGQLTAVTVEAVRRQEFRTLVARDGPAVLTDPQVSGCDTAW